MKTINLYFDFEFTSLSPDAQPISLGIVSDDNKSFYAEFSDFDINRCDDWVKENVVSKLQIKDEGNPFPADQSFADYISKNNDYQMKDNIDRIKLFLELWLSQFSDYQIQFICDCGTWDWYWMVQLLAKWEEKENVFEYDESKLPSSIDIPKCFNPFSGPVKTGLPKLPENISPVPFDLNDLIAIKQGITPAEAFDIDREYLALGKSFNCASLVIDTSKYTEEQIKEITEEYQKIGSSILPLDNCYEIKPMNPKHNAVWDANVIKECYNKLI